MKQAYGFLIYLGSLLLMFVLVSNVWIIIATQDQIIERRDDLHLAPVAVVLGTSRLTMEGENNPFFEARINAGAELYHADKVSRLLVSGDNESRYYNEPRDMTEALLLRGIPDSVISRDASGLRTLDSVIRLKTVFNLDTVVIVTQKFHAYRALFIANHYDLEAVAYVSDTPRNRTLMVFLRELVARPLAIIDLFILHRQPKYPSPASISQ